VISFVGRQGNGKGGDHDKKIISIISLVILTVLFSLPKSVLSDSLPKASQEMLKKLKLEASILDGIDKELQVPMEMIEGAKKEGMVKIRSTPWSTKEQRMWFGSFKERYPFIKIDFTGTNQQGRTIKTLVAFKGGRVLSDVVTSIGGFLSEYEKADALDDIRDIPN